MYVRQWNGNGQILQLELGHVQLVFDVHVEAVRVIRIWPAIHYGNNKYIDSAGNDSMYFTLYSKYPTANIQVHDLLQ